MLPSKQWDVPKLEELFLPYEVKDIKRTPIGQGNGGDARY